jgi:hypothetical protein
LGLRGNFACGYSKRALTEKLGIKEDSKLIFLNAPRDYARTLGKLPKGITLTNDLDGPLDFVQFFAKERAELETCIRRLKQELSKNGTLWISWPKRVSKVETDLSEAVVREIGLRNGLVDVKVCAVDETWSGLKVYRKKDRK